jgi:hypothetical protein
MSRRLLAQVPSFGREEIHVLGRLDASYTPSCRGSTSVIPAARDRSDGVGPPR